MNEKWDRRFLELARVVSTWSKDPSTKCGAVLVNYKNIVVGLGYNGYPRKMRDTLYQWPEDREKRLDRTIHAEVNAILNSNSTTVATTLYCYPYTPCSRCAIHIIQAGIARVVGVEPSKDIIERWGSHRSQQYFDEAEVQTCWYKGEVDHEDIQIGKYEG